MRMKVITQFHQPDVTYTECDRDSLLNGFRQQSVLIGMSEFDATRQFDTDLDTFGSIERRRKEIRALRPETYVLLEDIATVASTSFGVFAASAMVAQIGASFAVFGSGSAEVLPLLSVSAFVGTAGAVAFHKARSAFEKIAVSRAVDKFMKPYVDEPYRPIPILGINSKLHLQTAPKPKA